MLLLTLAHLLTTASPLLSQEAQEPTPEQGPPPVQVYVLLGQSNMLGFGQVGPQETLGTLENLVREQGRYGHLVDEDGAWVERDDVHYVQTTVGNRQHPLTVKGRFIGPELQLGHVLGDAIEAPVLILKACIGNRSLGWDLLPPGSEGFEHEGKVYAAYGESPLSWDKGSEPVPIEWYAGKQYDTDTANAKAVLADLKTFMPSYAGQGYELAGFVFWQGHKDQNPAHASRYEQNLVHLIRTLRRDFEAPKAHFALATIAFGGQELASHGLTIAQAQLRVDGEAGHYPEFRGNVAAVDARPFWRPKEVSPKDRGYHYNHNAETYLLVGEALGQALARLR